MGTLEARPGAQTDIEAQSPELKFIGPINTAIEAYCSKDWSKDQQDALREGELALMKLADDLLNGQWKDVKINYLIYQMGIELAGIHGSGKYETDPFWDIKANLDHSRIRPGTTPKNVFMTAVIIVETGKTPKENKQEAERIRRANSGLSGLSRRKRIAPQHRFPFNKGALFSLGRNPRYR